MRMQLRSHSNVLFQSSLTLLISNVKSLWIQNPCYHENHVRAEMAVQSDVHPSSYGQQSTCCYQVAIKLPSSMCRLSSTQVNLSCLDTYSDDCHHRWCWWWLMTVGMCRGDSCRSYCRWWICIHFYPNSWRFRDWKRKNEKKKKMKHVGWLTLQFQSLLQRFGQQNSVVLTEDR